MTYYRLHSDQNNHISVHFSCVERANKICLLCTKVITSKDFKRKLTKKRQKQTGKEIYIQWRGEGSLLTNILCRNCADKNETVVLWDKFRPFPACKMFRKLPTKLKIKVNSLYEIIHICTAAVDESEE